MKVGCYDLHLYCDNDKPSAAERHGFEEFPHQFTGPSRPACYADARERGWKLAREPHGLDLCPACNPKSKRYRAVWRDPTIKEE